MNSYKTASRRDFIKTVAVAASATGVLSACGKAGTSSPADEPKGLPITLAGYAYDRVRGLMDGSVSMDGCDMRFETSNIYKLNANAMGGEQVWAVQEIGLHG